jgi:hypothetical protein
MTDVIDFNAFRLSKRAPKRLSDIKSLSDALAGDLNIAMDSLSPIDAIATLCDTLGRLVYTQDNSLRTDLLKKAMIMVEISALKEQSHNRGGLE